jgi:hypothetical protein
MQFLQDQVLQNRELTDDELQNNRIQIDTTQMKFPIDKLPWDDFVIDFGPFVQHTKNKITNAEEAVIAFDADPDSVSIDRLWARVTHFPEYKRSNASPWVGGHSDEVIRRYGGNRILKQNYIEWSAFDFITDPENYIVFEIWVEYSANVDFELCIAPEVIVVGINERNGFKKFIPTTFDTFPKGEPQRSTLDDIGRHVLFTALAISYMNNSYRVWEYPIIPIGEPMPKRGKDSKPWTYKYSPRVKIVGSRQHLSEYHGGSHATPQPHTRRAHFAVLRHSRFKRKPDGSLNVVWKHQAWVGPREFIMNGSRYKVED